MGKHAICHVEWASTNFKKTQNFYGGLFGWKFEPWGDNYLMFTAPDGIGGGFAKAEKVQVGQSPTVYIQVDSIDPYLKKSKDLGGKVAVDKMEIDPNVGWMAHLADPDGNIVGVFQPAKK
ncbi:VOC family protein [Candidatus Acetothermia bacterium]|nr:VOC family protein [Candidatus Acetothermia bacterium]